MKGCCLICKVDFSVDPLNVNSEWQVHTACIERLQEDDWPVDKIKELIAQRKREQET